MENVFNLNVSKKVGNKKEKVGEVAIPFPTLAELGIEAQPTKTNEDGTPVYATDLQNFVFTAVMERVKGMARNKLVSGTCDLKPGQAIAATLEELVKPPVAGGNAETLKAIAALKRGFAEWLAEQGVAAKGQAALVQLFGSPNSIALQSEALRGKVAERVEGYAESIAEIGAAEAAYLEKVLDACEGSDELDLDDF